jgi:HEAT repeat protein
MKAIFQRKSVIFGGLAALVVVTLGLLLLLGRGKSVARLAADLRSPSLTVRIAAAKKLADLGPQAKEAVGPLTEALDDPDDRVRFNAAKALAKIGPDAKPASRGLVRTLADDNPETRYYSAKALSKSGIEKAAAPEAVPHLIRVLKDDNPRSRYYAAKCLREVGSDARDAYAPLQQATKDPNKDVRNAAASALKRIAKK